MAKIAPSILAADFSRLGEDVADICARGIDYLHIDVMDGNFVPNISFGSAVMKSLDEIATVPYDVHLMVVEPARYIGDFVTPNTEFITIHVEACEDVASTLELIKSMGIKAGISINPETAIEDIFPYLGMVDLVLVMSVHPGFGGQKFMDVAIPKIDCLKRLREQHSYNYLIEVDGGIGAANAHLVRDAGADVIVAGSAVFGASDRSQEISAIKG